jgi:hypothetical protein
MRDGTRIPANRQMKKRQKKPNGFANLEIGRKMEERQWQ